MSYLEELLPEFRKGAKIRRAGLPKPVNAKGYIYYKEGKIYNEFGRECEPDLGLWLSKNDWEVYEEPIDWEYIIDHKCLCWFWDDVDSLEESSYGYLTYHNKNILYCYNGKKWYKNCRPVRKDEVNFYKDKRDGNN